MTKTKATQRLIEAHEAMRAIKKVTAKNWEEAFPSFSDASKAATFTFATSDPWERRVSAMNTELNLRIAEFLTATSHD